MTSTSKYNALTKPQECQPVEQKWPKLGEWRIPEIAILLKNKVLYNFVFVKFIPCLKYELYIVWTIKHKFIPPPFSNSPLSIQKVWGSTNMHMIKTVHLRGYMKNEKDCEKILGFVPPAVNNSSALVFKIKT